MPGHTQWFLSIFLNIVYKQKVNKNTSLISLIVFYDFPLFRKIFVRLLPYDEKYVIRHFKERKVSVPIDLDGVGESQDMMGIER